ncbi:MAG: hypothetical protein ILP01_02520 [Clostridia bacterium]|nr:hypothetical protein [Clostridia bacterium]
MNENENKKNGGEVEIDLLRILGIIWHNIIIIMVVTLTVALIAMVFAKFIVKPTYRSSAMMYVNNKNSGTSSDYISTTEISAAKSLVSTYAVILKSNSTLTKVIESSGLEGYTPSSLAKNVSASSVESTEIFRITVTANDPEEARILVENITEILPDAIAGVVDGARVTVVDPATNGVKNGPSTVKYVLIGALLGFFLMSGLLIVFDLADDKIHEEKYLAENYSYPVLAVIPNIYIKYEGGSHYEKQ